jgi:hypothetical protein
MGIPNQKDRPDILRRGFPPSDCISYERYVAFCDVLGFRQMILKEDLKTIALKYDTMLREAKAFCLMVKRYPSLKPWIAKRYRGGSATFNDSILLWSNPTERGVNGALDDSDLFFSYVGGVFSIALKMGFPMRIGIAYGMCIIDPTTSLFLGLPIIQAYATEQVQDWIGVACHPSCFTSPKGKYLCMMYLDGWQCGPLIKYKIPIKSDIKGDISLNHTIDWPSAGQSDWGGFESMESILKERIQQYSNSSVCFRWERALDYYNYRMRIWKDIERRFTDKTSTIKKNRPSNKGIE